MARIDYTAIKKALKEVVEGAGMSYDHETSIEKTLLFDAFDNVVNIELDSRNVVVESISQGKKLRYQLLVIILVYARHFDQEKASEIRDTLISELEPVLMQNRDLNNTVDTTWLDGGQNIVAYIEDEQAFVSAGEIRLIVESTITT